MSGSQCRWSCLAKNDIIVVAIRSFLFNTQHGHVCPSRASIESHVAQAQCSKARASQRLAALCGGALSTSPTALVHAHRGRQAGNDRPQAAVGTGNAVLEPWQHGQRKQYIATMANSWRRVNIARTTTREAGGSAHSDPQHENSIWRADCDDLASATASINAHSGQRAAARCLHGHRTTASLEADAYRSWLKRNSRCASSNSPLAADAVQ